MKTAVRNMKKVSARVPEEVHKAIKIRAAGEGRSVSAIIEGLIQEYLIKTTKPVPLTSTDALLRHIKGIER